MNLQKSNVFFGTNVSSALSEEVGRILRMSIVDDLGTYLNVPAMWGRSKKKGLAYVKERILGKGLSQGGRKVLIKAMVQAIPAYLMNLFQIS